MAEEDGEEEEEVEDEPRTLRLRLEVRDEDVDPPGTPIPPTDWGSAYVREMMSSTRDMAAAAGHRPPVALEALDWGRLLLRLSMRATAVAAAAAAVTGRTMTTTVTRDTRSRLVWQQADQEQQAGNERVGNRLEMEEGDDDGDGSTG